MISINFSADVRRVARDLKYIKNITVPEVFANAANKALAGVRTKTVRELSAAKSINQKGIRQRTKIKKAFLRNGKQSLTAEFKIGYDRMPVAVTGTPVQTRKGTRVGRRSIVGAFIAPRGKKRVGVWLRAPGAGRLPIIEQKIDLEPEARMFSKRNMDTHASDLFMKEWRRILSYKLKKARV